MFKFIVIVFLVQHSVDSWVVTDVDIKAMQKLERVDDLDELEPVNIEARFSLIYPGTKWCGSGDVANNFNDLGSEWRTDMCCREHDYCPDTIPAGETKHNLTNDVFYTRLSCSCDETFRKCLQAANRQSAENIGVFYFNALGTKCYRKDYPVKKCVKTGGFLNKKCLVYSYDNTSKQVYQWFDVSNYR